MATFLLFKHGSLKKVTLPCCVVGISSSHDSYYCPTLAMYKYTVDNTQSSILIQISLHDAQAYFKMAPSGSQLRHS